MKTLLTAVMAMVLGAASLSAQVLFNDTFSSGTPASAGYYMSADSGSTLSVTTGTMRFLETIGTANEGIFKQFSAATLTDGQTLRLQLNFSLFNIANATNQLRVSIGNYTGSFFNSDQGVNVWPTSTTGYSFYFGTGSNTADTARRINLGATGSIFTATTLGSGTGTLNNSASPQSIVMVFDVARVNSSTFSLDAKINGTSVFGTPIDTTTFDYSTFNTIAVGIANGGSGRTFDLDEVTLSVIPEPTSAMLLLGVGAVLIGARARWRRIRGLSPLFSASGDPSRFQSSRPPGKASPSRRMD